MTTCLMDPPWQETGGGGRGAKYPTMPVPEIIRVVRMDKQWQEFSAAPRSHLWMWTTSNFRAEAHWMITALGFRYITDFVWEKDRSGTGQYRFSTHEHLLLCDRMGGKPMLPKKAWPRSVEHHPKGEHSAKPGVFYELVEALSPGPYLEMFARNRRAGWASMGNQLPVIAV